MTNIEKRILLNQREIIYALMQMNIDKPKISNGLGKCCEITNLFLRKEDVNNDKQR